MNQSLETMHGKVCMVTGANTGMGYVTALALAQLGATVVLVCRDRQRGEKTLQDIQARTRNSRIDLLFADLSSLEDIRQLVDEFKLRYRQLHVLINNAGVLAWERQETRDGFEMMFAVNHLAPFLLTNLLLDTLKASTPARIINITSGAARIGRIRFDDLQITQRFRSFAAYAQSKRANLLFTQELAHRLQGTGVTVNAADPTGVKTRMTEPSGSGGFWLFRQLFLLQRRFMVSPEEGASTAIYLATSPEVTEVTGGYFVKRQARHPSSLIYNEAQARQLWDISTQLINSMSIQHNNRYNIHPNKTKGAEIHE